MAAPQSKAPTPASTKPSTPAPSTHKPCFVDGCTEDGIRVIEVQAAPGVGVDVPVCDEHLAGLDAAKAEAQAKAEEVAKEAGKQEPVLKDTTDEAPYGKCHVCDQALGVLDAAVMRALPSEAVQDGEVALSWWQHGKDDKVNTCHEDCRCRVRDEEGCFRVRVVATLV